MASCRCSPPIWAKTCSIRRRWKAGIPARRGSTAARCWRASTAAPSRSAIRRCPACRRSSSGCGRWACWSRRSWSIRASICLDRWKSAPTPRRSWSSRRRNGARSAGTRRRTPRRPPNIPANCCNWLWRRASINSRDRGTLTAAEERKMAAMQKDPVLVVVQLTGGNDYLNTVVPYNNPLYRDNRKAVGIGDNQILRLDGDYGLPSFLAPMKRFWDEGKLAVMHGVGYLDSPRSHFRSMDIWHTCETDKVGTEGWLGRVVREIDPKKENVVTAVSFGPCLF